MRNSFSRIITDQSKKNKKIFLLSGDIGNNLFNDYKKNTNNFLNCGVAEQSMISIGAGLAMTGYIPVIYTIAPFVTSRCYEQIKVDLCYQNLKVILVGTGSGYSYSHLGPTHHSLEDISIIRTLPNINVVAPCDPDEVAEAFREALENKKSTYIRIGKKGEKNFKKLNSFKIGKHRKIIKGNKICIISTGVMITEAYKLHEKLKLNNFNSELVNMHSIKPLDYNYLQNVAKKFELIISIEEHSRIGGLGSSIAEFLSQFKKHAKHVIIGAEDGFISEVGSVNYLRKKNKMDSDNIMKIINKL